MDAPVAENSRRVVSVPGLIGWLSACVLAAAWGRTLEEKWQPLWAEAGAVGLVGAIGLRGLEKARTIRDGRLRERMIQMRLKGGLAHLREHSATLNAINAAVQRLAEHTLQHRQNLRAKFSGIKRWQSLLLSKLPLEVTPVEERGDALHCSTSPPIPGSLRQLQASSRSVAFDHAGAFNDRLALLTFKVEGDQQITFVVDIVWTQRAGKGFASGGTVLAVGIPELQDVLPELLTTSGPA